MLPSEVSSNSNGNMFRKQRIYIIASKTVRQYLRALVMARIGIDVFKEADFSCHLLFLFIRLTTTLTMMSISSVLLSAIIKVSATKALSAMRLCPSFAYRILLVSIFTHMCKFCTCGISRQFTFVVYVPYMPLNNSPVSLEKQGHLF